MPMVIALDGSYLLTYTDKNNNKRVQVDRDRCTHPDPKAARVALGLDKAFKRPLLVDGSEYTIASPHRSGMMIGYYATDARNTPFRAPLDQLCTLSNRGVDTSVRRHFRADMIAFQADLKAAGVDLPPAMGAHCTPYWNDARAPDYALLAHLWNDHHGVRPTQFLLEWYEPKHWAYSVISAATHIDLEAITIDAAYKEATRKAGVAQRTLFD